MEEKTNFLEKFWYIFVIIAVVLIGVVGTLWFTNQKSLKLNREKATSMVQQEMVSQTTPENIPTNEDETITSLEQQSDSDEIEVIEKDLQDTNFSDLDKEIVEIENEILTP